jgi:hypothetical protein
MNIKKKIKWKNNRRMKITKKYRYRLFEEYEGEIIGTDKYFICEKDDKGKLSMGIEEKEENEHFDHMYTNIYQWNHGKERDIMKLFILHKKYESDILYTDGIEFETFIYQLDESNVDERMLKLELVGDFGWIEKKKYLFFDYIVNEENQQKFV